VVWGGLADGLGGASDVAQQGGRGWEVLGKCPSGERAQSTELTRGPPE
jgi:hypothetical protein